MFINHAAISYKEFIKGYSFRYEGSLFKKSFSGQTWNLFFFCRDLKNSAIGTLEKIKFGKMNFHFFFFQILNIRTPPNFLSKTKRISLWYLKLSTFFCKFSLILTLLRSKQTKTCIIFNSLQRNWENVERKKNFFSLRFPARNFRFVSDHIY